jgi:hypothetical protein
MHLIFLSKLKFLRVLVMKYTELEVPLTRSLRNRRALSGQHTFRPFTRGKYHPIPNEEEAGCDPQSFWAFMKRENSLAPAGIRTPARPPRSYTQYRLHSTSEISLNCPLS